MCDTRLYYVCVHQEGTRPHCIQSGEKKRRHRVGGVREVFAEKGTEGNESNPEVQVHRSVLAMGGRILS